MITTINLRTRKLGWGWTACPVGDKWGGLSVEPPDDPNGEGTFRQLVNRRETDILFHSLGGAFFSQAWFYRGKRIVAYWSDGWTLPAIAPDNDGVERDETFPAGWYLFSDRDINEDVLRFGLKIKTAE